jgi:hypothetical protein
MVSGSPSVQDTGMDPRTLVVSASDSGFASMLDDLLTSLKTHPASRDLDVAVFDVGLTEAERERLKPRVQHLVAPGWDLDLGRQAGTGEAGKALTVRPFLPEHFPGYDVYLWMDADTWVQDGGAVELFVRGAASGALAIVPEVDRAYPRPHTELAIERVLGIPYRITSFAFKRYQDVWGTDGANTMLDRPVLNCGVFALAAGAPHWSLWREAYQRALHKSRRGGLDQISLNYVAATGGLPVEFLPSRCNWVCHLALPKYDPEGARFVEPYLPHETLGILHLTLGSKEGEHEIQDLDGTRRRRSLRRPH